MYSYHNINSDELLIHIPPLKIWKNLGKMKLNELGRQKLGRYRNHVSRHSKVRVSYEKGSTTARLSGSHSTQQGSAMTMVVAISQSRVRYEKCSNNNNNNNEEL